ncbi:MAG TPA: glycosyltransferase family 9 protein [Deltaproteobacteria bacterium]|nr:glycosyltransferase family 9 protein [Deltaproteobacteria bacterium]
MDILVIKLGALGDVINTLPLIINLKRHLGARIHWVVEPLSFPIVSAHRCVDNAICFNKQAWKQSLPEVLSEIRSRRYDLCLDLQRITKSALLCMAAKATRRIGFDRERCKEMTWLFPFERIPASDPKKHMVLQYLDFAEYLGIADNEIRWDIPVKGSVPFNLPEGYVVLNIGATKAANKWTPGGFASLAEEVRERYHIPCVLTGAGEDIKMAAEITRRASNSIIDLVGKTSIEDLIEVLAGSSAVVSCDTGPMHLGVALGKEVIALFGPANPRRTGPYLGHVIQKDLACSGCNKRTCSDPVCMLSIRSDDVLEKLDLVL